MRRFSETRRPHPLAPGRSASEGIRDERARLNAIRGMADEIVDTSDMTVHELRRFFMGLSRGRSRTALVITLLSFGYKYGVPVDTDLTFDVRCLPNPHFVDRRCAPVTGRDRAVVQFMEKDAPTREFIGKLEAMPRIVVSALHRGRKELSHHRHRLHRRPPSFRDDRGTAAAQPGRHPRRARARPAS